jgi:hypothetical protein
MIASIDDEIEIRTYKRVISRTSATLTVEDAEAML